MEEITYLGSVETVPIFSYTPLAMPWGKAVGNIQTLEIIKKFIMKFMLNNGEKYLQKSQGTNFTELLKQNILHNNCTKSS